jgi:methionyl aminopeptidase
MECGTRENESINERDGNANGNSLSGGVQHPAGGSAVNVESVSSAAVAGRNHIRLAIDNEADVANHGFVQDFVNNIAVVVAAFRKSPHLRAFCRFEIVHECEATVVLSNEQEPIRWDGRRRCANLHFAAVYSWIFARIAALLGLGMSITTQEELEKLQAVGRIVAGALRAMSREVRPGVTTAELDAVGSKYFEKHGARSSPQMVYGFPGVNCISVNDEVVHGIPRERSLKRGDLVKLDVTACKDGYHADAAVSVTVQPAPELSTQLVKCAEQAFRAGLGAALQGNRTRDIGSAVEKEVHRHGFHVIRELGGHGIGRTIHESPSVPNYDAHDARALLTEGLVLTIEPIIAAGTGNVQLDSDGWTVRTVDGSRAAHYEHTLVITRGEPVLLTVL